MEWNIKSEEDETFKIKTIKMGEFIVGCDGVRSVIAATEEDAVEAIEEMQEASSQRTKLAAPLENPKGLGWFDGTSWGTK
jgi:hypothetical protein